MPIRSFRCLLPALTLLVLLGCHKANPPSAPSAAQEVPGPSSTSRAAVNIPGVTAPASTQASPTTLSTTKKDLFILKVSPDPLYLIPGGKTKLKVAADRKGYDGPIALELRNLPADVDGQKGLISPGNDQVDIELSAGAQAKVGDRNDVIVLGMASDAGNPEVSSPAFTLSVQSVPTDQASGFDLRVEGGSIKLRPGGKSGVTVLAQRHGYDGDIRVELHNLPAHVSAHQATLAAGQNRVEMEITAGNEAGKEEKTNVHAVGTASDSKDQEVSPNFTVMVEHSAEHKKESAPSFDLKVEEPVVHLSPGSAALIKVHANRKNYPGPILVVIENLPAHVYASKAILAAGQDTAVVELAADVLARAEEKTNVLALGQSENHEAHSPHFKVIVRKKK
ncbi:MAG: hypothetical protein JO112_08105 [Planctomycetes bacterium]|nr:hypothetical protein [Planctomycetota bacterium]